MATDETNAFQRGSLHRRIFADHGIKYQGLWQDTEYTRPVVAILKLGIISGGDLISSTGKKYPIDLMDSVGRPVPVDEKVDCLLFDLVRAHLDYSRFHTDILYAFDRSFDGMAEIAQLGGIQPRRLESLRLEFRGKISARIVEGNIAPKLTHAIHQAISGEDPPPLANELSKIFFQYVPQAFATHIVAWTNSVLIALGNEPANENTLRIYVGKLKKVAGAQPRGHISITE
jgi:hypothetical protein